MKKSFLFVAALALTFAACQPKYDVEDKTVATFEESAISPAKANSEFYLDTTGTFQSGMFIFSQCAQPTAFYYSGSIVSNHTDTTFASFADAWKSVAQGAYAGKNYVVWNKDWYGNDLVRLTSPAVVKGMYVSNSIYTYNSMVKGDEYAGEPFGDDDYLEVIVTGAKNGVDVNNEVRFYLAQGRNILKEWKYIDLSTLGEIDQLQFNMKGSRESFGYLSTPAYFCIDNLGASK